MEDSPTVCESPSKTPVADQIASCWTLGSYRHGQVVWEEFDAEEEAREAFNGAFWQRRESKVLFEPSGVPCNFRSFSAEECAIILHAYQHESRETPDAAAVALAIAAGNAPHVPPDRPKWKQLLMQGVMQALFNRTTVEFFGASPLRNTSLCYFDAEQYPAVKGYVALTIDDAPCRFGRSNSRVQQVKELLQQHDARATFMLVGQYAEGHEQDLIELLQAGHELGNHAMQDRAYHTDSPTDFADAVDGCSNQIISLQRSAGVAEGVNWFRAPHGKYTQQMEGVLRGRGLTNVMCDTYASCPVVQNGEFIGNFLAERATGGSIILIHMPELGFRDWCMVGLERLLDGLHRRGLRAVTVGELKDISAGQVPPRLDPANCQYVPAPKQAQAVL